MERTSTGNFQLDQILGGGFPRHSVNIVMGLPGSGKTLLAEQLVFANGTAERPALYLTTLSEPLPKLVGYLQELSFGAVDRIGTEVIYDSLVESLLERPEGLYEHLLRLTQKHRPGVIVIDSFKAIMELVPDAAQWRKTVFELGSLFAAYDMTGLWVGEYSPDMLPTSPEFAVADGILELHRRQSGSRDDRFLRVAKLRGSDFLDGEHAFTISSDGLAVFPRLVGPRLAAEQEVSDERLHTGVVGLDELIDTGVLRGTSTMVAGPSGAGKTMLGLHFLRQGVADGEPGLLVNFQESPPQIRRAAASLGWDVETLLAPGRLEQFHTSPVELQMDSIVQEMLRRIEQRGVKRVVIDPLGDLERAAADRRRFSDYVYALTQEFALRQITAMLLLEAPGGPGGPLDSSLHGREVTYMNDNIILLSMELGGSLVRAIRILKTRGSGHDGTRHVLHIDAAGMRVE